MGIGLQNTAELKLTVTLDSKGINGTKKLLSDLANALNAEKAVKGMEILENTVKDLQGQLKQAKSEIRAMASAQEAAAKKAVAAEARAAKAVNNTASARRKAVGAVVAASSAEKRLDAISRGSTNAMAAYIKKLREKYGAQRALELVEKNRTAYINREALAEKQLAAFIAAAILQKKNLTAATKANATQQKAATATLTASQKAQAQASRQAALAAKQKPDAAKAAAERDKAWSVAERVLAAALKQGGVFVLRNLIGINRLRAARNADTKQIVAYTRALAASIVVDKQKNKALTSGMIQGQRLSPVQQLRENLSAYESQMDALFRASFRLSMVGQNMKRFGENIIRLGSDIMNVFGEFEYTMIRAAGAMEIWHDGINTTEVTMDVLQGKLLDLSKAMILFPASEVAEALYFWGSATGQVVNKVEDLDLAMSGLGTIMKAASMTNTDYESTIKGVYSILTQFYNGGLEEADTVTQKLFYTTQKTAAEFNDLIQSFKMVGPVAAQVGATFDEVNSIFGTLADLGLRGSLAGRGLRQFFIQMVRPSGPAQGAINDLWSTLDDSVFGGKSFRELAFPDGEFVGITEHVNNLAKATMDLTAADRLQFLARISTANQLPLLVALVARQRREIQGLTTDEEKLANVDDEYATFFKNNWDALAASWKGVAGTVQRNIEVLKISVGSMLADVLKPLADQLNVVLEKFQGFINTNPALVKFIQKFAVIAAIGSVVAGTLFIVAGSLVGLGAAIYLVVKSTNQWFGAFSSILAVVGLLIAAIVRNYDEIKAHLEPAINNIIDAFDNFAAAGAEVGEIFETLHSAVAGAMDVIVIATAGLVQFASEILLAFSQWEHAAGVVKLLAQAIGVLIASKITTGLLSLAAGVLRLGAVMSFAMGKGAVSRIVILRTAMMSLLGGLPGLIITVVMALATFGNDLPIISDLLGIFSNKTETASEKVDRLTSSFEGQRNALMRLASQSMGYETVLDAMVRAAISARQEILDAASEDPAAGETLYKSFEDAGTSLADVLAAKSEIDSGAAAAAGTEAADLIRAAIVETWTTTLSTLNDDMYKAGLAAVQPEEWMTMLENVFAAGISDPSDIAFASSLILDTIKRRGAFNESDIGPILDELRGQSDIFNEMTASEFRNLDIVDSLIGSLSSGDAVISDDFYNQLTEAYKLDDEEFKKFMETEIAAFMAAPVELLNDPRLSSESNAQLKILLERWAADQGAAIEEMDVATMAKRITDAISTMVENVFTDALGPQAVALVDLVERMSLMGGPEQIKAMIDALFADLGDGRTWVNQMQAGAVPDELQKAIMTAVQAAVDQGMEVGPELMALLETSASSAGEESGSQAKSSWIDGFTEAFSRDLDPKELKKLAKMGTVQEQVAKGFKHINKYFTAGWSGGGSRQSRRAVMEWWNGQLDSTMEWIQATDNPSKQAKRAKIIADSLVPKLDNLPKQARNEGIETLINVAKVSPDTIGKYIASKLPPGSKIRRRVMKAVFGDGESEDGGTGNFLSDMITSAITDALGIVTDSEMFTTASTAVGEEMNTTLFGGFDTALAASDWSVPLQTIATGLTAAEQAGQIMYQSGKDRAADWRNGWVYQFGLMDTVSIQGAMNGAIKTASAGVKTSADTWGQSVGASFVNGITKGITSTNISVTGSFDVIKANSPPKKGPLKDVDKWGFSVGQTYADNISAGINAGTRSFDRELRPFTGVDVSQTHKREVKVKLEVSSPDGTVNRQKQAEIRRGAMEALTVAGLEHYVTVG